MCRQKQVKEVRISEENIAENNSEEDEEMFIGIVESSRIDENKEDWTEVVQVYTNPKVFLKFKLDTGAQASIIPKHIFEKIPNVKLKNSETKLVGYGGSTINNLGKCTLKCKFQDKNVISLDFIIVDSVNNTSPAILGLNHCLKLGLIKRVNEISSNNVLEQYDDVFKGIGCLKLEHKIILKENSASVVFNARKIPLSIKNEVKNELDRLEKQKIIEKVTEPTDWVYPLVVVRKPNGKIRL